MKNMSEEIDFQKFHPIDYCTLKLNHFDTINIQLRNEEGKPIYLKNGKVIVILNIKPRL